MVWGGVGCVREFVGVAQFFRCLVEGDGRGWRVGVGLVSLFAVGVRLGGFECVGECLGLCVV